MKFRIDKADVLFSLLIRERAGFRCEVSGKFYPEGERQGLHCSHFIGRRNKAVRWHPLNACAHGFRAHQDLSANPLVFGEWIRKYLGPSKYAELQLLAMKPIRLDPAFKAHIENNLQRELDRVRALRAQGVTGRIEFANPYDGEVQPLPRRKPKARKAKPATSGRKKKIQSRPFSKEHRPLRRKVAA